MDVQPKKSGGTAIREWTQFVVLVLVSGWGVYTFIYKEFTSPKSAPINITLDLQARKAGASATLGRSRKGQLIALEVKVIAKNPSSRSVYLLRNFWVAHASNIEARTDTDNESIDREVIESLNSPKGDIITMERHGSLVNTKIVASGTLFTDEVLKPGEAISRTIIFHIPNGLYDHVQVTTYIPTAAVAGLELEWHYDSESFLFSAKIFRLDAASKRQEVPVDKDGNYSDKQFEFQAATSASDISLWR